MCRKAEHLFGCVQEKQQYMWELEELIPQMEGLIQDKKTLQQQVDLAPHALHNTVITSYITSAVSK